MARLYDDLAAWWPLMSAPEEYVEEAAFYVKQLLEAGDAPALSLLEIGSGGGNNASHMKAAFREVTLVDLAPGMLAVSRALNPECEHVQGDMRTVRLGREFDRVFIHDAICYMATEDDVRRAVETAFVHCRPGGAVLLTPDHVRETFHPGTDHGGNDGDGRGLRYLEWTWDPDPTDSTYTVDYTYVMRERDGSVRAQHERHIEGLFSRDTWLRIMTDAGFVEARSVPYDHPEIEPGTYELFVGVKPRAR